MRYFIFYYTITLNSGALPRIHCIHGKGFPSYEQIKEQIGNRPFIDITGFDELTKEDYENFTGIKLND